MKTKSILALIAVISVGSVLTISGCKVHRRTSNNSTEQSAESTTTAEANARAVPVELSIQAGEDTDTDFAEKEELRRKFSAKEFSSVSIYNISGKVTIETADTDTAEVLIVRSAKKREDLKQYRQVKIELHDSNLAVRVENDRKSLFSSIGSIPEGRQRVIMRLPRKIDFDTNGINGDVTIGELRGRVELHGINGQIKASRIAGATEIDGINGGIDAVFAPLTGNGIEINGVNGNIDLRFEGEVNADLNAWGVNGQITPDLPDVQAKDEEPSRRRFKARIGTGGTQIRVGGINGNLHLMKAEKSSSPSPKVASK